MPRFLTFDRLRRELRIFALPLIAVAVTTVVIYLIISEIGYRRGTVIYLIPVLIAATRWGLISALVAAVGSVFATAYFFYPPYYDLHIRDPQEVINLLLYVFVAVVVSQLASRLRQQLEMARQREIDLRDLYAFSRRLTGAFDVSDIHAAIEEHLATVLQRKVILFASAREASNLSSARRTGGVVPQQVLDHVAQVAAGGKTDPSSAKITADGDDIWLVRSVSPQNSQLGVIAINLGSESQDGLEELRLRLDAVLADATATLERLDIAHAISEARMRSQTDQLREALIESVSHELRTPLASIIGAATVLNEAPALRNEKKLKALVHDVHEEAERLNNDIQNLLDASRISSEGIKPRSEWADPADIIHSAIDRCRRRLANHQLIVNLDRDMPLVHIDPVLVQQSLVQILDNAVKYSPTGSLIALSTQTRDGSLSISVKDEGSGLTQTERAQMWDRFVRGKRHAALTSGSGLGLWIANAFIAANGGNISAVSAGAGYGTTVTIELPVMQPALPQLEGDEDE